MTTAATMTENDSAATAFEEKILETVKWCQQRKETPFAWATRAAKCVGTVGLELPSVELGQILVNHLCFSNNNPSVWMYLDHALTSRLVSPLHVLSLLTSRVFPHRRAQPEAYRLYLELIRRYAFIMDPVGNDVCKAKIIKSVDDTLKLSETYKVPVVEHGHALLFFFFTIVIELIDCTLDDWGLKMTSVDRLTGAFGGRHDSDNVIDCKGSPNLKNMVYREEMRRTNSFLAMEILDLLTDNKRATVLLRLIYLNMPEKFNGLLQRMQFIDTNKLVFSNLKSASQALLKLSVNLQRVLNIECKLNKRSLIGMLINIGSCNTVPFCNSGAGLSACWVPFDIYLENAMDGKQLPVTSAIDILAETLNTLQVFNRACWQETFLALWHSALRLVQRVQERDPLEGPIPHLEARLCVLLSIVPLSIARVLNDETELCSSTSQYGISSGSDGNNHVSRKQGLVSSLQALGHFSGLLCPPTSVVSAANSAAAKAASFISGQNNSKGGVLGGSCVDTNVKTGGNMRHLIVEACIARKLMDSSAYSWPGYVPPSMISSTDSFTVQKSPWSTFMEGAPLNESLVNSLVATPASSLLEIEKLYKIALHGSEEEKPAAAKILCGACLSRGWNIQEHVVHYVVKLLSPPVPSTFTGSQSHLIDYMPMLSAILFGASSVDTVHILSLHGVVPQVAASLMPLCEAFGSLTPTSSQKLRTGDESSLYMVFSSAFLFLLRLWKFYRPPLEQCITGRGELTLEFLLLLYNNHINSQSYAQEEVTNSSDKGGSDKQVYIDSFPKLRAWYCQNKSSIASTLSGPGTGSPVHQVANKILNMIFWKLTKNGASVGNNPSTPSSSSLSGSSASTGEDSYQRPVLPAWDVLEAVPFVLEAILSACAHGRLSSRDMTTGLRDLVDFLPASLGAIISYFSAEITRGIWKPVLMNGVDWPSPKAILQSVESEMKEILAAAGVNVPYCSSGGSTLLPLPMAALVSLTITFKLDKSLEYIHAVAGPALESCASSCPWRSMPIVGSLWAQKVRRWHEFIVVSCSRSVFRQDKDAVAQLLKSCFTSFLGTHRGPSPLLINKKGVNGLLGSIISSRGVHPSIAPGFLYLRSCRTIHNVQHVNDVIVGLVAEFARESGEKWTSAEFTRLKYNQPSLAQATARAKEVATLGASLLCIAGGPKLVQELYQGTMPTRLLSTREEKLRDISTVSRILEGYAMAYLLVLSGSFVWGVGVTSLTWGFSRRTHVFGAHLDFIAGVLAGNITLGCDPATWKAYVSCLVGLVLSFAPAWIQEMKQETLRTLAGGLRGWHECELALSLLEHGGVASMGHVAEMATRL